MKRKMFNSSEKALQLKNIFIMIEMVITLSIIVQVKEKGKNKINYLNDNNNNNKYDNNNNNNKLFQMKFYKLFFFAGLFFLCNVH
jgi:hypothetical protein